jgi:hypothetical protein
MGGTSSIHGDTILVGSSRANISLERRECKRKKSVKINVSEIGYVLDSNDLGQDPMVNFSEHGNEPKVA